MNPADEVSVKRVLNVPKRGVGDGSVGKLDAYATGTGSSFVDVLRRADSAGVTGTAVRGIQEFLELLDGVADLHADDRPAPLLEALLERSGYLDELRGERTIESEGRLENLAELVGSAQEAESIDQFLEQVSLVSDADEIDGDDSEVVLMTVHAAKGLEFPAVFIIGLEDGVFPHLRSIGEPDELEEERRLAYVALTRRRSGCTSRTPGAAPSTGARSTTRPAASSTRSPTSSWRSSSRSGPAAAAAPTAAAATGPAAPGWGRTGSASSSGPSRPAPARRPRRRCARAQGG